MSDGHNGEYFVLGLLLGLLVTVPLSVAVISIERGDIQEGAAKAGAGEWTIDAKTGIRAWKWTPAVKPVEK